jgi:HD-GYP domain-containing protein (c-di-GMP phosphodiesterase class II)
MPENSLSNVVHAHFLEKVALLAARRDVIATETIFDSNGRRLAERGQRFTPFMRDALLRQTLKKPLEICLAVDGAPSAQQLVETAARVIESSVPVASIVRASQYCGSSPLALLAQAEFGHAIAMMMAINEQDLDHCVTVSLLSVCLAKTMRLTESDQLVAALAGLLHDIGDVYLDPALQDKNRRWQPHEWAQAENHPRVGRILVDQLESYPLAVGRAISEHHERFDGSGYPSRRVGNHISPCGQAVAAAEMIAGVLSKDASLARVELALKIIPGEHARDLVAAIAPFLHDSEPARPMPPVKDIERLFWRISSALEAGHNLAAGPAAQSPPTRALLAHALSRIEHVQMAFVSTGLTASLRQAPLNRSTGIDGPSAMCEIEWHVRDVARELALHSVTPAQYSIFAPLINLLDDDLPQDAGQAPALFSIHSLGKLPLPDSGPFYIS